MMFFEKEVKNMAFTGFTAETIDFLWALRMQNEKAFMEQNRERYYNVLKEPFDLCSAALYEAFTKKHQLHMDYAISRINRDIRFSKDKSPYKARKWVVLKEALTTTQHWKFRPVFYFELMPEGYAYGMGFYEASPAYMRAFRQKIDASPATFTRLAKKVEKYKQYILYGDCYKRMKSKHAYDKTIQNWYERKSLDLAANREIDDLLFSPDLVDFVVEEWEKLLPMYTFLKNIVPQE